jgi:hypothetical protein
VTGGETKQNRSQILLPYGNGYGGVRDRNVNTGGQQCHGFRERSKIEMDYIPEPKNLLVKAKIFDWQRFFAFSYLFAQLLDTV